jgi:hypothetical protein
MLLFFLKPARPITAELGPESKLSEGFFHGTVQITNSSDQTIRLVGSGRAKCEGLVGINAPFELKREESVSLPCLLPWHSTTLFTSGAIPLNIEVEDELMAIEVKWVLLR